MGIPTEMFTVMFAIGRIPGWIAHWNEIMDDSERPKPQVSHFTLITRQEVRFQ